MNTPTASKKYFSKNTVRKHLPTAVTAERVFKNKKTYNRQNHRDWMNDFISD